VRPCEALCHKGFSQLIKLVNTSPSTFSAEVGTSHRMIIYYEKHRGSPPAHVVPKLAKALGVSADQLLGIEEVKTKRNGRDTRLWRRFKAIEKLSPAERKPIIQVLDAFLAKARAE
jgi:transcriptional regulator with XRE-family HTH domain